MSFFKSMKLIRRCTPGGWEKGQWKVGIPADTQFKGTAQPAPGRAMELLPEGKRNTETILVFAPMSLQFTTADPELKVSGDIIIWEGRQYEVFVSRPWKGGLIPHWELIAVRKKEGER